MMEQIQYINVDDIIPNRFQPRKKFEEDDLNELAESIKQHGIIQPLVLRRLGNKFEIIAGERRYKAANIVGLKQVPSIVMDLDDRTSAEIALAENIQRKDLTAIEKAKSYKQILGLGQITQEELAKKMGKSQPTVSNTLRLLELTEEVQTALLQNRISERHARSLLSLKDPEMQKEMLKNIIKNRMTVRETDLAIKEMLNNSKVDINEPISTTKKEEEIIDFSQETPIPNNEAIQKEPVIEDTFIIEDIPNNNAKQIPDFDQIDINKEEKQRFLNNYTNLDDEAANMNFETEETNNEFDNFINIPNDEPILNTTIEKEEKEVSETPMITDDNFNQEFNNDNGFNNPNQYQQDQQANMYPNSGMMNQANMYQPYPGQMNPYQTPQGYLNQYQQPNMYPNNGMMNQANMYQPYPGPVNPYQAPQGYPNQYQQDQQLNTYPNNGMINQPFDNQSNFQTEIPNAPMTDTSSYNSISSDNVIEPEPAPQAIIMQHDITGAVAVIRNTVMNLQNNGYMIDITEDDMANAYNIVIKLEK